MQAKRKPAIPEPVAGSTMPRRITAARPVHSPARHLQAQLNAMLTDDATGHWTPAARCLFVLATCGSFWSAIFWLILR